MSHMHAHTPAVRASRIVAQLQPRPVAASDTAEAVFDSPLDAERANPSFPIRSLTYLLDGGEGITNIKELVQSTIEQDEILNDPNRFGLTRDEARRRTMAKIAQVVQVIRDRNADMDTATGDAKSDQSTTDDEDRSSSRAGAGKAFEDAFYSTLGSLDPSWSIRIGVHFGLFQSAINGSGTDAQRAKYAKSMQEMRMIGCFAMTELGHGSYLQGLETTATFDRSTQEFVIDSPTVTATKWWIGMAGQTATHAAVFAKLIIDGKDHGIQTFVVPIRALDTGLPVENVSLGDMGSKMGRNGLDNGWIRFDRKRIPRDAMLMRWAKVDPDGKFTPPPTKQIAYNSLIGTRVELFKSCADELKKALCIAIRYSLVRKQFLRKDDPTKGETKLLDYPTHQARLFPILAHAFALHFTAVQVQSMSDRSLKDLEANIHQLPQLHATAAGLKAIGTWYTNDALEVARQCLGGMGYSVYAVLPGMKADFAVQCTWEGDNTVLSLQCAKFLVKSFVKLSSDSSAPPQGVTHYLAHVKYDEKCTPAMTESEFLNPAFQLNAFHHRAGRLIMELTHLIGDEVKATGVSYAVASERFSQQSLIVTRAHVYAFMLECMQARVNKAPKELQNILKLICDLFALHEFETHLADFLEDGFFSSNHAVFVRRTVRSLLGEVRPHALPLVDAFNLPDFVIESPLGRADGDVYRALFEQVKNAAGASGVPEYFNQLIRPLTDVKYKPEPVQ